MQRVEMSTDPHASAYSLFQTAIALEGQVRGRTEVEQCAGPPRTRHRRALAARDASERANRFKTRFFTAVGHDPSQALHARGCRSARSTTCMPRRISAGSPTPSATRWRPSRNSEIHSRHLQARSRRHHPDATAGVARRAVCLLGGRPGLSAIKRLGLTGESTLLAVTSIDSCREFDRTCSPMPRSTPAWRDRAARHAPRQ